MKGSAIAIALGLLSAAACGPAPAPVAPVAPSRAAALLPDVRLAKDRPPVVLVARDGDPSGAIAVAVTTSGLEPGEDDPEAAVALAGMTEARLVARGLTPIVVPSWSGFRAAVLITSPDAAPAATDALREALTAPASDKDVIAARKKLGALASRPLRDASLARWARCVGSPHAMPARAGKSGEDLGAPRLERWRAAAHGLARVAVAVVAPFVTAESVATAIARGPAWKPGAPAPAPSPPATAMNVDVYEAAGEMSGVTVVHATLDVGTASDAVTTAEALGDPHGPLASRLAALDLPFRMREVVGAAEPRGGCVGIVLEAPTSGPGSALAANDLATRVADAVALVHVEAQVHLAEGVAASPDGSAASAATLDGRTLARRAGDAREAAARAAWWALADAWLAPPPALPRPGSTAIAMRGSVALGIPAKRGGAPGANSTEGALEPSRELLASAVQRATSSWQKPVAEGRARVEPGQGETWVLLASPCGTESESDADAGLTALFTVAAAEMAKSSPEARVEPWIVPDGAGLLVHGPALPGETASAQARRLADVVARSFASDPITVAAVSRARAELLRRDTRAGVVAGDGPVLAVLASAIAPGHASWFLASGREDTLERSADAAVLANVDAAQGEAALRAADRWIDRRGEAARACRAATAASPPRPGTYATEPRGGAGPEAYLAFPFAPADDKARAAAVLVAAALDGEGGLLDKALGGASTPNGLARSASARVVGWPRSPALVIRVVSTQASLDGAVMQARALVDRVKKSGLVVADHERATVVASREALAAALDPRARIVATWRGEPIPTAAVPLPRGAAAIEDVRAFSARYLAEDTMVIVAARPPRPKPSP